MRELISLQIESAIKALLSDIAASKLIESQKHTKQIKSKYFAHFSAYFSNLLLFLGQLTALDPGHLSSPVTLLDVSAVYLFLGNPAFWHRETSKSPHFSRRSPSIFAKASPYKKSPNFGSLMFIAKRTSPNLSLISGEAAALVKMSAD